MASCTEEAVGRATETDITSIGRAGDDRVGRNRALFGARVMHAPTFLYVFILRSPQPSLLRLTYLQHNAAIYSHIAGQTTLSLAASVFFSAAFFFQSFRAGPLLML